MSGRDDWDELLNEARERLREQEEDDPNSELGDEMTPEPGAHFQGRWRGEGKMTTKERGLIPVFLVWGRGNDEPGFLYAHSKLVDEVAAERPQVGDEVLVLRGETKAFEKNGEQRSVYPYVLRKRECSDPLPALGEPGQDQPADEDALPY